MALKPSKILHLNFNFSFSLLKNYVNYFTYRVFPDQAEVVLYGSNLNINLLFFPLKKLNY